MEQTEEEVGKLERAVKVTLAEQCPQQKLERKKQKLAQERHYRPRHEGPC